MRLDFEKLNNTRDLGGMSAAGGRRIKSGKLLRSGHLFEASAGDLERLSGTVGAIVDFRTSRERAEKPDPAVPGADYFHLPIFEDIKQGVTRDEDSTAAVMREMMRDAQKARTDMCRTYADFAVGEAALRGYRRFVSLLSESREKAVLWHCTAGKDRAGFASVIIEEILGVDRALIEEDYLITEEYLAPEVRQLKDMFRRMMGTTTPENEEALDWLFGAKTEYLNAVYDEADRSYGGFDGFLRDGLGVGDAERARLRELYLE